MSNWKTLILFIVLSGIIYSNSLSNTFHYDDRHHIVNNRSIRTLNIIPKYFVDVQTFSQDSAVTHYRPLLLVTYALNYFFSGLDPKGYHVVNLAFHVGSAFVLFLVVKAMLEGTFIASLSAGLIFLVHPFNSEVINYISARSTVMCAFFYLLAFYWWVRFREVAGKGSGSRSPAICYLLPATYFYIASLFAFVLAMLTKEIAVTIPFVIWVYDRYFYNENRKPFFKTVSAYIPYVLFVIIPYLIIIAIFKGDELSKPMSRPLWSHVSTELVALVSYIKLMILPVGLSVHHDISIYKSLWHLPVVFSGAILFLIIIIASIMRYRQKSHGWRFVSFMTFWFFIVLLPTTIIPLNAVLQENRGYLAGVSFATIAGLGMGKIRTKNLRLSIVFLTLLLLLYSVTTHLRNRDWKDEITLWSDTITKYPTSETAYLNLSMAYRENGIYDQSIYLLKKFISINPDSFQAHKNLGWIYKEQGHFARAFEELEYALRVKPNEASLHNDIGAQYYEKRMFPQAEQHLLRSIELNANYIAPRYNLGLLYITQEKWEAASKLFKDIISLDPGNKDAREKLDRLSEMMKLLPSNPPVMRSR